MKILKLSKGAVAIVDADAPAMVFKNKWFLSSAGYVVRSVKGKLFAYIEWSWVLWLGKWLTTSTETPWTTEGKI